MKKPIYVTRPVLPPLEDLIPSLQDIWERKILTNSGPYHQRLEQGLREHLGVEQISLFTNATIALMTALQALEIRGEVITTPYSFVATSHAMLWNGLRPVFVDVDPETLNMDPDRIERAITPATTAIMPVHCYGHPCDVAAIQRIADRHGLKVIYDAAHAFGVCDGGGSVLRHGDLAILSFHATKVFNTFEGGAIISRDASMKARIDSLKNFGLVDECQVTEAGLNGKMSEFNAALGVLQLEHVDRAIAERKLVDETYRRCLAGVRGIRCLGGNPAHAPNFAYFPILVGPEALKSRDEIHQGLKDRQIFARRYFFPLLSDFPMYRELPSADPANLPVAKAAAEQVLCLPIYPGLERETVEAICAFVAG